MCLCMCTVSIILVLLVWCVSFLTVRTVDRFVTKVDTNVMLLEAAQILYVPFSYSF